MNIPGDLRYTPDHEWARKEGDLIVVGVTDFAQRELGDIVYVEIETEGETLEKEEVFGTIEAVKTVSDLFMPISGEIVEVNSVLEDEPQEVNTAPYEAGWLVKILPGDAQEWEELLSAEKYKELIGVE